MSRFIYNLLWPIGLLFFLPRYLLKMFRRGGYRAGFGQRLGLYDRAMRARLDGRNPVWLHAVSVGEVSIALKLASALRALRPDQLVVLTTTTTTGFAFAQAKAPGWIEVMYSPLDFWPIMRRAFSVIEPGRIALVEAEVWPNLMAETRQRRVPVCLVNARLSPRSEQRFRRFNVFVRPMFRLLDLVCVQNEVDIARWTALGIERERIAWTGSVKYDPEEMELDKTLPESVLKHLHIETGRPVLLGGSTHHGEEETLARAFQKLRRTIPNLLLIVAPRHVERSRAILITLQRLGLKVVLRSQSDKSKEAIDCLLIDSTGELRHWYAVADVVFIGKSLTAHGGQNPAEAIVAGKPVVFGPHMENFSGLADVLVNRGGAVAVQFAEELEKACGDLLRDGEARARLVRNAQEVLAEHRGATARTAELLVDLVKRE
jgi:3-deoxy-D-manno-octulosonic-acid transferase